MLLCYEMKSELKPVETRQNIFLSVLPFSFLTFQQRRSELQITVVLHLNY
jgi:hypothetical protein